ncbi:MAG: thiamine-phosphate synthase family protein [Thermoplasmatota archaeon]
MLPPHLIIVEEVLPEVRRRMAVSLYSEGMSQEAISRILGTSQAMVSRYLRQGTELHPDLELIVRAVTSELTAAASAGEGSGQLTDRFCLSIDMAMSRGMLDARYRSRFGREPCKACMGSLKEGGRVKVLEDLEKAVRYLSGHPIPNLVPALKVNIASGVELAESIDDIAAYPGRLPDRRGRIADPLPPEFGASRHLAAVLLTAMGSDKSARSVISLAFNEEIRSALEKGNQTFQELNRTSSTLEELLKREGPGEGGIVVDPGDFGIEPCLYIFGSSPLEVSARAVEIQNMIGGNDV